MKSKPLTVIYRPELLVPSRTASTRLGGVRLAPGGNIVSESELKALQAHFRWDKLSSLRVVEVVSPQAETEVDADDLPRDLSGYNVPDGQVLIATIDDLTILERWQKSESAKGNRVGILRALADRIEAVTKPGL